MTHVRVRRDRLRRRPEPPLPGSRRGEAAVALSFLVAMLAGFTLLVVYLLGGQTQIEGLLLTLCLGGIGVGIVLWVQELMDIRESVEERHPFATPEAQRDLGDVRIEEQGFTRRKLLIGSLFGALAGLVAALIVPAFSLGPAPGRQLFTTNWKKGLRLVTIDNKPVKREDLEIGAILTVFPEGHTGESDDTTILIRLQPGQLQLPPERLANAPDGYVAFSKLCTHAGCPVGLYRASQQTLICPCHQSTFDVKRGAVPVFGPAARALPQLPIQIQPDGTFIATGPYPEPVGPSFWNMYQERTE